MRSLSAKGNSEPGQQLQELTGQFYATLRKKYRSVSSDQDNNREWLRLLPNSEILPYLNKVPSRPELHFFILFMVNNLRWHKYQLLVSDFIRLSRILFGTESTSEKKPSLAQLSDVKLFQELLYWCVLNDHPGAIQQGSGENWSVVQSKINSVGAILTDLQGWLHDRICSGELSFATVVRQETSALFWDEVFGIKTDERNLDNDLLRQSFTAGSLSAKHADALSYMPTTYTILGMLQEALTLTAADVKIDLGGGTGRTALILATQPLKKAVVVDLNAYLTAIGRENVQAAKLPSPVEFITGDVADYNYDEGTVFYLYNPFGQDTLKTILEKIKNSVQLTNPRRVRIVYNNPLQADFINSEHQWLSPVLIDARGEGSLNMWEYVPPL